MCVCMRCGHVHTVLSDNLFSLDWTGDRAKIEMCVFWLFCVQNLFRSDFARGRVCKSPCVHFVHFSFPFWQTLPVRLFFLLLVAFTIWLSFFCSCVKKYRQQTGLPWLLIFFDSFTTQRLEFKCNRLWLGCFQFWISCSPPFVCWFLGFLLFLALLAYLP